MLLELFSKGLPRLRCDLLRRISLNLSDLGPCGESQGNPVIPPNGPSHYLNISS